MSVVTITVVPKLLQQTEAAERGGDEERGSEWRRPGRSPGGVRELAGGRAFEERTGPPPGQRPEDGRGHVWAAYGINGEGLLGS